MDCAQMSENGIAKSVVSLLKVSHDNTQFWWEMSANSKSAAIWDCFAHSEYI